MDTFIYVFMVFACLLTAFSMVVIARDIIIDGRQRKQEKTEQQPPVVVVQQPTPVVVQQDAPIVAQPTPVAEPVVEPVAEPVAEAQVEETPAVEETAVAEEAPVAAVEEAVDEVEEEFDENSVTFSKSARETLEEKYLALPAEYKSFYDEIVKHATIQEGSKRFKNARYEEFKIGQARIVRVLIKRGIIVCEFIMQNTDFKNYINETNVNVRQAATVIKVVDVEALQAVKDSIDIVVKAIAEEKEYKKQIAREKRKKAREEKKLAEEQTATDAQSLN